MSRVGKHIVAIPNGVNVSCSGNTLTMKKGNVERVYCVPGCIKVDCSSSGVLFSPLDREKSARSIWGTSQRNVSNIVNGLDKGFRIELEMVGVGYKASVSGKKLTMQLGFSHDVEYDIPEGVSIACPKPTTISITGHDKKQIGDVAAFLRKFRKPEPYKGKGVMRVGEFVYRKEGKKK
ncbi:MAG: 50S ribosomal protein L6 [Alphaproteobacteria bacterium]|nr:50S ribosomal protein L6 [Alphaproteobacteria bacterium]